MEHDLINRYIEDVTFKNSGSMDTASNYRRDLQAYINYLSTQQIESLFDVDRSIAAWYVIHLRQDAALSQRSIQRHLSTIRGLYRYCIQMDRCIDNPFSHIKAGKTIQTLPDVLSEKEVNTLLDSINGNDYASIRDRALFELMYASGMRLSEIASLRIDDLSDTNRRIRIKGKGNVERTVFYNHHAQDALNRYRSIRSQVVKPNENALWINQKGDALTPRGIQYLLNKAVTNANLRTSVHPHILRHSFATHLLNHGADLKTIQLLLGHASMVTTQIYTHISVQQMKDSFAKSHLRMEHGSTTETKEITYDNDQPSHQ